MLRLMLAGTLLLSAPVLASPPPATRAGVAGSLLPYAGFAVVTYVFMYYLRQLASHGSSSSVRVVGGGNPTLAAEWFAGVGAATPFKGRFLYTQDDELLRRRRKAADRMAVDAANQHAGTVATRPSTHWPVTHRPP